MAGTYKDIQKMTGLSLSTISKYFNGGNMREQNRLAVEKAIAELDFRVNDLARGLKSRRSRTIGVLLPELNSTFHTAIIAEVEKILRRHGYGTIICDSHLDAAQEQQALQFLMDKMVDGIIAVPYDKTGKSLAIAKEREIPVVLIDRLLPGYDAVILDNEGASRLAVQEFIACGHREIGLLCGPDGIYTMRARRRGFEHALREYGLSARHIVSGQVTVQGGYESAMLLLRGPQRPTAVFCSNYEITLGTVIALNECNLHVPDQISLIGFDNLELAQVVKPALTMVVQPMQEIASAAASRMLCLLEGPSNKTPQIKTLCAELVRGQSVLPRF